MEEGIGGGTRGDANRHPRSDARSLAAAIWGRADGCADIFFSRATNLTFSSLHPTMPPDSRRNRAPSKRKGREGPEDAAPRKKQQIKTSDSADEDFRFEDYGSAGDDTPAESSRTAKGNSTTRNEKEYPSVNDLKRRIRDVKRLLNKPGLSADARVVQERALTGYEQDLAEETARRDRSQMISRYHFVRFLGMQQKFPFL